MRGNRPSCKASSLFFKRFRLPVSYRSFFFIKSCLISPPSLADMHTHYSKTRAPHDTFCRFVFATYRHGWRRFYEAATFFHSKNSRSKIDKEVNFWTCHGRRWFYAVARLHCKRVGKQCTRTYIVYRACGCFLYAPSIYSAYLQKANGRLFSKSLVQQRQGCHRSEMSVRGHFWASSFLLEKGVI